MAQTKKTHKEDHMTHEQQMRARIKDAAFKLMADQGIDQVSMRQIAEKLHVTKPVLYYYFKDKEDLCHSIIEDRIKNFDRFLEDAAAQGLGMAQLLKLIFEKHLEFYHNDPYNSKFVARAISYALNNQNQNFVKKGNAQINLLHSAFERTAKQEKEIPMKGLSDLERLERAVSLQIMLHAYVQLHMPAALHELDYLYNKDIVSRLAQIIVLGINEYYKGKKK